MTENAAIQMLMDEHKVILRVIAGLEQMAVRLREGVAIDPLLLQETVLFMREYADRCHHGKEEDLLFPAYIEHGVPPQGCPISALLHEHKSGRELVGQLEKASEAYRQGSGEAGEAVARSIDGIVKLYPNHIWKEDEMVFPMAESVLPAQARKELYRQFKAVNARQPDDLQQRSESFAERLAKAVKG